MSIDGNTLLRLAELTVDSSSQESTVRAVDRAGFEVAPGELVGLVDESGTIELDGGDRPTLPGPELRSIRSHGDAVRRRP